MTRKLVIFWGESFLITVKRKNPPFFEELVNRIVAETGDDDLPKNGREGRTAREIGEDCVVRLASGVVVSFDPALEAIETSIDKSEADAQSMAHRGASSGSAELRELHALKRKATILRRTLWRTVGVLETARAEFAEKKQARWRRVCALAQRTHFYSEELEQAVAGVMALQLAVLNYHIAEASHRTNEVMRTLTLFSVVFLPLSFIAGVYGMNFDNIPELRYQNGYFWTLGGMGLISLGLLIWFLRKGYLPKDWCSGLLRPQKDVEDAPRKQTHRRQAR